MAAACFGFLWYNGYPAQVFMGDTGSLALGAAIGTLAIMIKKELLLPILCGIFFIETLSVIIQTGYFKYTKRKTGEGKRVFKMAPLHHHYEALGVHEAKIVIRFWIVTAMLVDRHPPRPPHPMNRATLVSDAWGDLVVARTRAGTRPAPTNTCS